ncbi:MAG: WecB/TagA/CpsF family glycosyltransferase [Bacteroidales bacterium]|nr:WecB/TagA/CpsF family glycosyltransferase [Bacteroidales bacterium]
MTINKPLRTEVLGIPVDCVTMDGAVDYATRLIEEKKKGCYILAINPEKVILLQKDESLLKTFKSASLLIPDGIGVVLAMRWLKKMNAARVPGSELMPYLCKMAAEKGYCVFLYGAKEEVNQTSSEKLCQMYPGLKIVGRANGYLKEENMSELVQQINSSAANILFVALGSPKQEQWIQKWADKLNVNIIQGIGGTLDTIVGTVKRAPAIFCRFGLEWFYRLITNPKRLYRQKALPVFAWKVIKEKVNGEKFNSRKE